MLKKISSSELFWKEHILKSSLALNFSPREDTTSYVISTITRYKGQKRAFALYLAEIMEDSFQHRSWKFQDMGDEALVRVGLFSKSIENPDYVSSMGVLAYKNAASLNKKTSSLKEVFYELSKEFNSWKEVLNLTSRMIYL